jgi:formylglycine-generating enzyme required for sulfatase activity
MAGNVWQWTSVNAGDGKREVRGGSWDNPPDALRTSKRLAWPENADVGMGFRCVKD